MSSTSLFLCYCVFSILIWVWLNEVYTSYNNSGKIVLQNILLDYQMSTNSGIVALNVLKNSSRIVPPTVLYHPIYAVSPLHRISSCVIPKNMSTVLVAILCMLFDPVRWSERGLGLTQDLGRSCNGKNELHRLSQMEKLSSENWTNTIFVREPMERFLSGYLFMCAPGSAFGGNCFDCGDDVICVLQNLHEASRRFASGDLSAESNELWHLGPQIWHCEYLKHSEKFKVVKYSPSNKDELETALREIMSAGHVDGKTTQKIMSEVFGATTSHSTSNRKGREELLKRLESPEALQLLTEVFFWDFVSFGFPFPKDFP